MSSRKNLMKAGAAGAGAALLAPLCWLTLLGDAPERGPFRTDGPAPGSQADLSLAPRDDGAVGGMAISEALAPPVTPPTRRQVTPKVAQNERAPRTADLERQLVGSASALARTAAPSSTTGDEPAKAPREGPLALGPRRANGGVEAVQGARAPGSTARTKTAATRTRVSETERGPVVTAPQHLATFDADGLTFLPRDEQGQPVARGRLTYRLEAVERDGQRLYDAAVDGPGTLDSEGHEVRYQRNEQVRERYVARDRGVEQMFDVAEFPPGEEDQPLVIRGRVETQLAGSATEEGGLLFADGDEALVAMGHAVAFDSAGRQTQAPIHLLNGVLEIHVPGAWLADAQAPLLIDPLIGSAKNLTNFVSDEEWASLCWNPLAEEWLLVCVNDGTDLTVSRLEADGDVISGGTILDSSGTKVKTAVAWSESSVDHYLIAYEEGGDVYVIVIESDFTVVSASARIFDPTGAETQTDPDVAYDPSRDQWLVVWADSSQSASILCEAVATDGTQQGTVLVEDAAAALSDPTIAYSATSDRYAACYVSGTSAQDVVGRVFNGAITTIVASPTIASLSNAQVWPDVAWNATDNEFGCAFQSDHLAVADNDVFLQRFDTSGTLQGSRTSVAISANLEEGPAIAWGGASNTYWITYDSYTGSSWDVFGREVDDTGAAVTTAKTISSGVADEFYTAVAYNSTNSQWLEVWEDGRAGTDFDIWGQVLETDAADTTAPSAPVIATPANNSEVEDSTPLVTGTAEALSTVEVLVGGSSTTPATTTSADANGDWSVSLAETLTNGSTYSLTATATDAASNVSSPSTAVSITVVDFSVTFSGDAFLLEPERGETLTTTVTISDTGQTVTVKTTNAAKFKLVSGGVEVSEITGVSNNQVITLIGLESGPGPSGASTLRAQTSGGTVKADRDVLTKALHFEIEAQCPTRNAASDRQDGFALELGNGIFDWSFQVLPSAQGRSGLAPSWVVRHNSRAYSQGGNFGVSPFDLFCFMRVKEDGNGDVVWQEPDVREYTFDTAATGGKTARARYEVVSETLSEVVLRSPGGGKLRFVSTSPEHPRT